MVGGERQPCAWRRQGSPRRWGSEKILTAAARPKDYFDLTFTATAGVPYHLWLHGHADGDDWANDSVFVQFSGSVTESGGAIYRIGTTSATEVNLEECKGCGLKRGWAWQDNGWGRGVPGPHIYFAKTGPQTLRVQTREDGLSIDQIVLSPSTYLETRPPAQTSDGGPVDDTDSPGPKSTKTTLEVLDWNIHHGVGTDGDYDIERIARWIVKTGANVVSLNEVERLGQRGGFSQRTRDGAVTLSAPSSSSHRVRGPWHLTGGPTASPTSITRR